MEELLYFRQFLGGGQGLLQAGFLVGLFLVVIFRPERIRLHSVFIMAFVLFGFSIIAPSALTALFAVFDAPMGSYRSSSAESRALLALQTAVGPGLFGLSVVLGLLSLIPAPRPQRRYGHSLPPTIETAELQPPKHPLE